MYPKCFTFYELFAISIKETTKPLIKLSNLDSKNFTNTNTRRHPLEERNLLLLVVLSNVLLTANVQLNFYGNLDYRNIGITV